MVVPENSKLQDDILPELEFAVTPCKLTDNIKVDLWRYKNDEFIAYLVELKILIDDENNDVQMMPSSEFPKFCKSVRDAFRTYKVQHANV